MIGFIWLIFTGVFLDPAYAAEYVPKDNEPDYNPEYYGYPTSFIVGGTEVTPKFKYPWMAALKRVNARTQFCGGSFVARDWVLTAAHCSFISNLASLEVQAHRHNLDLPIADEEGQSFKVVKVIKHPQYNGSRLDYDYALWKVDKAITNSTFPIIDIAPTEPHDQKVSVCAGWGATREGGRLSPVLLQVGLAVVSNEACQAALPQNTITERMICAGGEAGKDSCQGDSGGPLILNADSENPILIGVVSWGIGCARPGLPGVYSRVSTVADWIRQTIEANQAEEEIHGFDASIEYQK
jgi:trypsin